MCVYPWCYGLECPTSSLENLFRLLIVVAIALGLNVQVSLMCAEFLIGAINDLRSREWKFGSCRGRGGGCCFIAGEVVVYAQRHQSLAERLVGGQWHGAFGRRNEVLDRHDDVVIDAFELRVAMACEPLLQRGTQTTGVGVRQLGVLHLQLVARLDDAREVALDHGHHVTLEGGDVGEQQRHAVGRWHLVADRLDREELVDDGREAQLALDRGDRALLERGLVPEHGERLADGLAHVDKVDDARVALVDRRAVEAADGLHGAVAGEHAVNVHGVQHGLVEAREELVGHDHHAHAVGERTEGALDVAVLGLVGVELGPAAAVEHEGSERHHDVEALLVGQQQLDLLLDLLLHENGVPARAAHDHRLGLEEWRRARAHNVGKVAHDEARLGTQDLEMARGKVQHVCRGRLSVPRPLLFDLVDRSYACVRGDRRVVLQSIEHVSVANRVCQRVRVEWFHDVVGISYAKEFQCLDQK